MCRLFLVFFITTSLTFTFTDAQFKIIGLLSESANESGSATTSIAHPTNAEGRNFDNQTKLRRIRPNSNADSSNNIIKVRIIDEDDELVPSKLTSANITKNRKTNGKSTFTCGEREMNKNKRVAEKKKLIQILNSRHTYSHLFYFNTVTTPTTVVPKTHTKQTPLSHFRLNGVSLRSKTVPDQETHAINFHNPDLKLNKILKYRNNYKSKCTCEQRINCPKIQMTISRCKPNYFLCCR